MDMSVVLPEECITQIISLTSPRDACRLSAVSPTFKTAADSDTVWEGFLPSDYQQIVSNSASSSLLSTCLSKKDLYLHLCHNPIIINNGTMSLALEKESGKKCYMVGARGLTIIWGTSPRYWMWPNLPESRFAEVAELRYVWWLEIKGKIETSILSPQTTYIAYLVFKFSAVIKGFGNGSVKLGVYFEGRNDWERRSSVALNPPGNMPQLSKDRGDGWMEIEMGEFFNENGDDGTVVCSLLDDSAVSKFGLIIEGIELRPKYGM